MTGETKPNPTHEIVVRRTITLTNVIKFIPEVTYGQIAVAEQAANYERNMPLSEKIAAFIEMLEYVDDSELDFGETVTVQEIQEN